MRVALGALRLLERLGDRAVMPKGRRPDPGGPGRGNGAAGSYPPVFRRGGGCWGCGFLLGAKNLTILTPSSRLLREASTEETRPYVFTAQFSQFSLSHAC